MRDEIQNLGRSKIHLAYAEREQLKATLVVG